MPRRLELPPFHPARPGLVRPVPVDPTGRHGPTRKEARGPHWRRTSRGYFVPATVERTVEQRILEAAVVLPDGGAVTGWAALRWRGARWFDGLDRLGEERPVVLVSPVHDIAPQAGFRPSEERLHPSETLVVDGIRVAIPARAVFFEMRYAETFLDRVVAMDMAAFADLVSLDEERAYIEAHPGWTGVPLARTALPWCDENSWSPWETWFGVAWSRVTGRPRPGCNVPVFDLQGRHVGTPDLIDEESAVLGQYDGAVHLAARQRAADVRRDHAFREVGLESVSAMAPDIVGEAALARRIQETYDRAARLEHPRAWTVEPPSWWQPTLTVEQRRSLKGNAREALERRRRFIAS